MAKFQLVQSPKIYYSPAKLSIQYLNIQIFCQSRIELIKMNNNSQNTHSSTSSLQPSPERVEPFEELIEISQSPQENLIENSQSPQAPLLARVNDLEIQLAQVLHKHSALQTEHESLLSRLRVLKSRLHVGEPHIITQNHPSL